MLAKDASLRMGEEKGFSAMRMARIGRKFLYCRKALFWLPCCAAGAMALLLAANGVWVSAQAAAPGSQAAATQASTPASPTDIVGIWQGTLHMPKTDQHPQIDLRLVVKISKADAGALKAVGYSIDQGGQSIPVATINFQNGVLKFTITVVDRKYEGKIMKQMAILVQKLLADRCALKFHHEQRPLSVYAIRLASGGPKMTVSSSGANAPPGLYTAVQEQLGLKIESTRAPDDVIVIDHVEHPSPN
jgi:hypothetical protein